VASATQPMIKSVYQYDFIKVGRFKKQKPDWSTTENYEYSVYLDYERPDVEKIEQTMYLIFIGDQIKYVGEYKHTWWDRCIKRRRCTELNYFSHDMGYSVRDILDGTGEDVTLWFLIDPIMQFQNGPLLNCNRAIELALIQDLIADGVDIWNKNDTARLKGGKSVREVFGLTERIN